jgi:hypothetical protein
MLIDDLTESLTATGTLQLIGSTIARAHQRAAGRNGDSVQCSGPFVR